MDKVTCMSGPHKLCLFLLQLVLMQEGAAAASGLLRGGEARQGDDLDRVLHLSTAVSIQGVVELRPVDPLVQFIFFGHRSAECVTTIHEPQTPQIGFGSLGKALLGAKSGNCVSDGSGGGAGGGAVVTRTLELGQGRGHPAAVGVAQYQTLLGAGLRSLGQSFLQVHLDGCKNRETRT